LTGEEELGKKRRELWSHNNALVRSFWDSDAENGRDGCFSILKCWCSMIQKSANILFIENIGELRVCLDELKLGDKL
jgi:hypothetical protein